MGIERFAKLALIATAACHADQAPGSTANSDVGKTGTSQPREVPFAAFACSGQGEVTQQLEERANALRLSSEMTHVELRRKGQDIDQPLATRGVRCAGATQGPCKEQFETKTRGLGIHDSQPRIYAVTTTGDAAEVWIGADGLRRLFGEIDTPEEAWFVTMAQEGIDPYSCGAEASSAHRTVAAGFELRVHRVTKRCEPLEEAEFVHQVSREGKAALLSTES
jgi:hypothetical protein